MITRYAIFEGRIKDGKTEEFRAAVLEKILPAWKAYPGALAVRVSFEDERDDGAPEFPMILAISYPDRAAYEAVLVSSEREAGGAATAAVLPHYFEGRIHHHLTEAHDHEL